MLKQANMLISTFCMLGHRLDSSKYTFANTGLSFMIQWNINCIFWNIDFTSEIHEPEVYVCPGYEVYCYCQRPWMSTESNYKSFNLVICIWTWLFLSGRLLTLDLFHLKITQSRWLLYKIFASMIRSIEVKISLMPHA